MRIQYYKKMTQSPVALEGACWLNSIWILGFRVRKTSKSVRIAVCSSSVGYSKVLCYWKWDKKRESRKGNWYSNSLLWLRFESSSHQHLTSCWHIFSFCVLFLQSSHSLAPDPTTTRARHSGLYNLIPHVLWNTEGTTSYHFVCNRTPQNLISRMRAHYNIDMVTLTSPSSSEYYSYVLQLWLKGLETPYTKMPT